MNQERTMMKKVNTSVKIVLVVIIAQEILQTIHHLCVLKGITVLWRLHILPTSNARLEPIITVKEDRIFPLVKNVRQDIIVLAGEMRHQPTLVIQVGSLSCNVAVC